MDGNIENIQASYNFLGNINLDYLCHTYLGDMTSLHKTRDESPANQNMEEAFRYNPVRKWLGEDCEDWARNVADLYENSHGYIDIHKFKCVTGQYLLRFTEADFSILVGSEFAPIFFSEFQQLKAIESGTVSSSHQFQNKIEDDLSSKCTLDDPSLHESSLSFLDSEYRCFSNSDGLLGDGSLYSPTESDRPVDPVLNDVELNQMLDDIPHLGGTTIGTLEDQSLSGDSWNPMLGGTSSYSVPRCDPMRNTISDSAPWGQNLEDSSSCSAMGNHIFEDSFGFSAWNGRLETIPSASALSTPYQHSANTYDTMTDELILSDNSYDTTNTYDTTIDEQMLRDIQAIKQAEYFQNVHGDHEDDSPVAQGSDNSQCIPSDEIFSKIKVPCRKRFRGVKNWEFVMKLLIDPRTNPSLIEWEDQENGIFRLKKPDVIAKLWASRNPEQKDVSYNNFARGLRHHYRTGTLVPIPERQLVYRCGPPALAFLESLRQSRI